MVSPSAANRGHSRKQRLRPSTLLDPYRKPKQFSSADRPIFIDDSSFQEEVGIDLIRRRASGVSSSSASQAAAVSVSIDSSRKGSSSRSKLLDPRLRPLESLPPFLLANPLLMTRDESHIVITDVERAAIPAVAPSPVCSVPQEEGLCYTENIPSVSAGSVKPSWEHLESSLKRKRSRSRSKRNVSMFSSGVQTPLLDTSAPSDGFALSGPGKVKFSSEPAPGAEPFIGKSLGRPTSDFTSCQSPDSTTVSDTMPSSATKLHVSAAKSSSTPSSSSRNKKKIVRRFVPPKTFSEVYFTKESSLRASVFSSFSVLPEKRLDAGSYSDFSDVLILIKNAGLNRSVFDVFPFSISIIHEFYCNLTKEMFDSSSALYGKVFIRGKFFSVTPGVFNQMLGTSSQQDDEDYDLDDVVAELTGGAVSVWPNNKDFRSSFLQTRYFVLHKIALSNWMPSKHVAGVKRTLAVFLFKIGHGLPIDLGQIIFDSLESYVGSKVNSSSIIFPSIIFRVLCSQKSGLGMGDPMFEISLLKPSPHCFKKLSTFVSQANNKRKRPVSGCGSVMETRGKKVVSCSVPSAQTPTQTEPTSLCSSPASTPKEESSSSLSLKERVRTLEIFVAQLQAAVFNSKGGEKNENADAQKGETIVVTDTDVEKAGAEGAGTSKDQKIDSDDDFSWTDDEEP